MKLLLSDASQGISTLVGVTVRYASPAACVSVQVALAPPLSVTIICLLWDEVVVFSPTVNAMLNVNSCVAPGSPLIAAPLLVCTPAAVYLVGRVMDRSPVPSENVSLLELLVPVMVTVPPAFVAVAVACMVVVSALPACTTVLATSSQLAAENVIVVERELRPVLLALADTLTVSLPLPEVLLGVSHDEYAIIFYRVG